MNQVKLLLTYRYSVIIHDLTAKFCLSYLSDARDSTNSRRTYDQMAQAARSGRQNIVEGVGQPQTSKKGEIKLLGVSKASFEELLTDYEDVLRQRGLKQYPVFDQRVTNFRKFGYRLSSLSNLSDQGDLIAKPHLVGDLEQDANLLLTLCHLETYLLHKQIAALERRFVQEGGFTEQLFNKRKQARHEP